MFPNAETRTGFNTAELEAIRMAVSIAQSECVCQLHLSLSLLTDAMEPAGIQPFRYELGASN